MTDGLVIISVGLFDPPKWIYIDVWMILVPSKLLHPRVNCSWDNQKNISNLTNFLRLPNLDSGLFAGQVVRWLVTIMITAAVVQLTSQGDTQVSKIQAETVRVERQSLPMGSKLRDLWQHYTCLLWKFLSGILTSVVTRDVPLRVALYCLGEVSIHELKGVVAFLYLTRQTRVGVTVASNVLCTLYER